MSAGSGDDAVGVPDDVRNVTGDFAYFARGITNGHPRGVCPEREVEEIVIVGSDVGGEGPGCEHSMDPAGLCGGREAGGHLGEYSRASVSGDYFTEGAGKGYWRGRVRGDGTLQRTEDVHVQVLPGGQTGIDGSATSDEGPGAP